MNVLVAIPLDLAAIRHQKRLSLEQISEITKIRVSWLRAVEEGRWSDLPDGIYRRSYIRQYAGAVGVDAQELLDACPSCLLQDC